MRGSNDVSSSLLLLLLLLPNHLVVVPALRREVCVCACVCLSDETVLGIPLLELERGAINLPGQIQSGFGFPSVQSVVGGDEGITS